MIDLRQSTSRTISIGPFVDATDAVTFENALTITPALRKLSKAGSVLAATSDGSNATFDADGRYRCTLTATDTNTVGDLELQIAPSGALPWFRVYRVLPAQVYDSIYVHPLIARAGHYGTAQAGSGASSLVLASGASSVDNAYRYALVYIHTGTGAGQWNYFTGYTGSSRTGACAWSWPVATPDATSQYCVFPEVALSTLAEVGASLGARVVDGSTTHDQSLRLMNAVLGGKASGLAGTTAVYRDLADTKNRVSATVDASGNRTAVTRDLT